MPTSADGLRKLSQRTDKSGERCPFRRFAHQNAEDRIGPRCREMLQELAPVVYVLPTKENEVFLQNRRDVLVRKLLSYRSAVLVIYDASRLVETAPAPLPRHVTEIRILEVERMQKRINPAKLKKLPPIEVGRPAARIEAGIGA